MGLRGGKARLRLRKSGDDALAHFACRLARERHGDDPLGTVDMSEQREEALYQKLGLAGTRGRLDQERAADVQCTLARLGILRGRVAFLYQVTHRHRLRDPR